MKNQERILLKVQVLTTDTREADLLINIGAGVAKTIAPSFEWEILTDRAKFETAYGVFKIQALGSVERNIDGVDLVWPRPSEILSKPTLKERVWKDLQEKVIPVLAKTVVETKPLAISAEELQRLLRNIGESKQPFYFEHPDGFVVGVNTTEKADVHLNSGDISSMLAAAWIFGAKAVRIT